MPNVVEFQDYQYKEIHTQEELAAYFSRFQKGTIYRAIINYKTGVFKIRAKRPGQNVIQQKVKT